MSVLILFAGLIFTQKTFPQNSESEEEINISEYNAEGLRDPFGIEEKVQGPEESGQEVAVSLPQLDVQGLVWGGIPQAIINNRIVRVGDTLEGARVIKIDKNGVTVSFNNKEHSLRPLVLADKPNTAQNP